MIILIKGYTFDYQLVDAKSDARLLRAIYQNQDGRLCGCNVSIRGLAGLQIEVGDFLVCGRHLAFDEVAVVPTTTLNANCEYARIKLVIDLTEQASNAEFTQARFGVEGSPTESGFPALVKQNINADGTKYELEIALVKLDSTQHISEIIRSWDLITPQKPELTSLTDRFDRSRLDVSALQTAVSGVTATLTAKADASDMLTLQSTLQEQQTVISQLQSQVAALMNR